VITRVWHGWTTPENAPVYENMLLTEIFEEIRAREIPGFLGISLCRHDDGIEVEFMTTMWFDSIAAVRHFAGENYELSVVPPKAQAVLARYDKRAAHYETPVPPPLAP
jgi:hypothetical protein